MARLQTTQLPKIRVRRGDTVRVLLGKDRGKRGKVLAVLPRMQRVIVEGINMRFKHVRARRAGERGQRVQVAAPLTISNVQVVCPACKKGTRVGMQREADGTAVRVCKKCGAALPQRGK